MVGVDDLIFGDARATAPAGCDQAQPLPFTVMICGEMEDLLKINKFRSRMRNTD